MWAIVMTQSGGCDNTIGCGVHIEPLDAETLEEAIEEAKELFFSEDGEHYLDGESSLEEARLIQDDDNILPLDNWRKEHRKNAEAEKNASKESSELAEYKRLQKKFGAQY